MKKLRSIGAILLALCMLLPMSLNAFVVSAADELSSVVDAKGEGSIGKELGNLHIYKFSDPKEEKVTEPPITNNFANVTGANDGSYVDPQDFKDAGLQSLGNVIFQVTRAVAKDGKTNSQKLDDYTLTGASYKGKTDADGSLSFLNLPIGIYYVQEVNADGTPATDGVEFFVSIPMTNPDGDSWMYDVYAYPKNPVADGPDIEKKLIDPDVLGDILEWKISAEIPADIADAKNYVISDTLDNRLSFVDSSLKVYFNSDAGKMPLSLGIDYALTNNGQDLEVELTAAGRAKMATAKEADRKLYVEFQTEVIDPSGWDGEYDPITNTAVIDYTNSNGFEYEPNTSNPENPEVIKDPYGIKILKQNRDGAPLANAVFNIYVTEQAAKDAIKNRNTAGACIDASGNPIEVTTDEDGIAYVYLLDPGQTYYLVEVAAPEGYKALINPIKVTTPPENDLADRTEVTQFAEVTILNIEKGPFELPETGGTGTVLFTFIGLLLIGVAIVVYTVSKKKHEQHG